MGGQTVINMFTGCHSAIQSSLKTMPLQNIFVHLSELRVKTNVFMPPHPRTHSDISTSHFPSPQPWLVCESTALLI